MLRGYVNREWDRIKGLEHTDALQELEDSLDPAKPSYQFTPRPRPEVKPEDRRAHARQILGVDDKASFSEVRKAYERLSKRGDPSRFPAGSPEAIQAKEILIRVQWAYGILSDGVDETERRFRTLEID